MIVVEIYTFVEGQREIDLVEYNSVEGWNKDQFIMKMAGSWVGHKIYNMSAADFNALSLLERNNLDCIAEFDKDSYIEQLTNSRDIQAYQKHLNSIIQQGEEI